MPDEAREEALRGLLSQAQAAASMHGAVAPSMEVLREYASEWERTMEWLTPFHDEIAQRVATYNRHFLAVIVGEEEMTLEALDNHVLSVSKMVLYTLLKKDAFIPCA